MSQPELSRTGSQPQRLASRSNGGHRRDCVFGDNSQVNVRRSEGHRRISQSTASQVRRSATGTPMTDRDWAYRFSRTETFNQGSTERCRQYRGERQSGRGGMASHDTSRLLASRTFSGHLTSALEKDAKDYSSILTSPLNCGAPEFLPGRAVISSKKPSPQTLNLPNVKPPKPTADDLGARIHEDISNSNYECAICTEDVLRTSQVWSCTLCWVVVHLSCVKKWHSNQEKQQDLQFAHVQPEFSWRCPGCNSRLSDDPGSYHCWCGKDVNPHPAPSSLPPHCCGQTCSKPRPTCPHPCSLQCHAGPCPPCGLVGPPQYCFCGKSESRMLCRETDYENGWSCQKLCEDLLPCGEHLCSRPCHTGLCGECLITVEAKCYCGQSEKLMPCYEKEEPQLSYSGIQKCLFEGVFTCDRLCLRSFDCGVHKCSKICHSQKEKPSHCPYSADSVTHCPCGKTPLGELLHEPRSSCEDAIPHCEKLCHKKLRCGHLCASKCHTGACGFCNETVDVTCKCGRVSSKSICHQGYIERPMCTRVCQAKMSCGRHNCSERCCSGQKKATERQSANRKHKLPRQNTLIEAEHICIKTCKRKLKCGAHQCQQICHPGPCASCPEGIFTEISCDCGRNVLQPPQPCGSKPPDCYFNCQRRPDCGHPAIEHNCHSGDISCPKCPFLVSKWCACGKEKLHSQPCHLREARCGKVCGEQLRCGLHSCRRFCHRAGECEDVASIGEHCEQPCGKQRLCCEHPCRNNCHGQTPCNELLACTAKAVIWCACGVRQQQVHCLASSLNPTPSRPDVECDDECLRVARNRRLAAALKIDPASHENNHVPYADLTLELFEKNTVWAESREREFRVFAKSPSEIRLRFKPMMSTYRRFLHNLAEDYGLESKSEDVEPHRCVIVFKSARFVSAPHKTLAQCVKIRALHAAEAAPSNATTSRASSTPLPPRIEPFNGFLLIQPRFGLTIDQVIASLQSDLTTQPSIHFVVSFLPSEEILLRAITSYSAVLSPTALEQALISMKARIAESIDVTGLAKKILLCSVDFSGNHIIRRDEFTKADATGWSVVAGRGAAKPDTATPVDEPVSGRGRVLVALRKKQIKPGKSWIDRLDKDIEC